MIVITGGAGFIGSAIIWELNNRGITDILLVDLLGNDAKWKNLLGLKFNNIINPISFINDLESGTYDGVLEAIIHLGACSATTETDADYLLENNYRYTIRIGAWQSQHCECRYLYASSAATYGDGLNGYSDDHSTVYNLKPLNMYGYSKHLADCVALKNGWLNHSVALKYFNVYGPNEYHKKNMRSVVCKAWPNVSKNGKISLFRSYHDDYKDGEQKRDFLYVKDAISMTLFFLNNHNVNGIFNIGSGVVCSWNNLANALFAAANVNGEINYIPMPDNLHDKYQYYTCAMIDKLREAGCDYNIRSIDVAIIDYAKYLKKEATLGMGI